MVHACVFRLGILDFYGYTVPAMLYRFGGLGEPGIKVYAGL
jgi:hypothetical protein